MKKGALDLSVNSIIVFVLAFAMLSVGIYVTNRFRDVGASGLDKAAELIKGIEENPTSDNPLVGLGISLELPATKKLPLALKFYNSQGADITAASVDISSCKSTDAAGTAMPDALTVVSAADVKIARSSAEGIPFTVQNKKTSVGGLIPGETYICKLKIMDTGVNPEVYSKSFFVNVLK